ncbi:MAG TPA: nucleoside monophosphate kinase [Spirochaetota bacterium]|nr:nucleoside monophosphate kinase [Spirochaetota bacterium]HPQ53168.1 nucleoside monophosphate kinase [Spirochaetota bacterium]
MTQFPAVILMGPTGSGKTPFGDYLEKNGFWNTRCHHFDFGENLRETAYSDNGSAFSTAEKKFLRDILEKGALLENESFSIALKILESFIARRNVQKDEYLLMNGLPRHIGQAEALKPLLEVTHIFHLDCTPDTVLARISTNAGGDRTGRTDDDITLVCEKLRIFHERTSPVKEYYLSHGAGLITFDVEEATSHRELYEQLHDIQ